MINKIKSYLQSFKISKEEILVIELTPEEADMLIRILSVYGVNKEYTDDEHVKFSQTILARLSGWDELHNLRIGRAGVGLHQSQAPTERHTIR